MRTGRRLLGVLCAAAWVSVVGATPGQGQVSAVLQACEALRAGREVRERAAEAAAARFVQGGTLWAGGSIPGFASEWLGRAGGLMPVRALGSPAEPAAGDVVVYGSRSGAAGPDAALLRPLPARDVLAVVFGPEAEAGAFEGVASFHIPAAVPAETPLPEPALATASLAALWAFTGDLVAACTRHGRMPTMWQSIMVPGSRERNERYRAQRFHEPVGAVPPVAPGVLGDRYLDGLCEALRGVAGEQARIAAAGALVRGALGGGRTIFHANMGHFEPARLLPEGFPVPLSVLPARSPEAELARLGRPGDVLVAVWYTALPAELLETARRLQAASVCILAGNPTETRPPDAADVLLDPHWVLGDALVEVPGYDVRILPPSGVLNATVFYAVLAEAAAPVPAAPPQ